MARGRSLTALLTAQQGEHPAQHGKAALSMAAPGWSWLCPLGNVASQGLPGALAQGVYSVLGVKAPCQQLLAPVKQAVCWFLQLCPPLYSDTSVASCVWDPPCTGLSPSAPCLAARVSWQETSHLTGLRLGFLLPLSKYCWAIVLCGGTSELDFISLVEGCETNKPAVK